MKHIRLGLALAAAFGLSLAVIVYGPPGQATTTATTTGACPTSQWVNVVGSNTPNLACAQPTMSDLSASGGAATVAQGGTGLTSGTSGGIPYYSSSSAMTSSAALAANGVVIGGGAGSAPATITAGTAGQLLVGSAAAPAFATPGSAATQPSNPSAVSPGTSTAQALGMGGGTGAATFTPALSGRVYYDFTFSVLVASTTNGATFTCRHGTGTAPANAATTGLGTADSTAQAYLAGATTEKAVVHCSGLVTGLTLATPVWFDVSVLNTTGSQAVTVTNPQFNGFEF